ncbi:chromatin modification- protein eaf6 [Dispira parvispora]|uniref:Chromatin modification-related protein EAF6 n=1 Tax=Dispira parvispora TaxID=1520584 RepID=A0A9W8E2Q9_9FUNG|nr:chromatin modification- protein eaf6 [Dispira parvispora]
MALTSSSAKPDTLKEAETELQDLLVRKRQVDRNLATLEASIYAYEGSYLEDTHFGNIMRGFEGYLASRGDRKRHKFTESDRIFSNSSSTYQKALEAKLREEQYAAGGDDYYYSGTTKGTTRKKKSRTTHAATPPVYRNPKKMRTSSNRDTEEELDL